MYVCMKHAIILLCVRYLKKKNSYDTNPKKRAQVMRLVKLILKREINFCLNFKLTQLSDCL